MAGGNFGGGNGTPDSPYLVEDAADLDAVRNNNAANYRQVAHIDLSSFSNWRPLFVNTSYSAYDNSNRFYGTYDGGNYNITGLKINLNFTPSSDGMWLGLFGMIDDNAVLKRIHIVDCDIVADSENYVYAGALAGGVYKGLVYGCSTSGNIRISSSKKSHAGGLYGHTYGNVSGSSRPRTIEKCKSNCNVSGSMADGSSAGGFIGYTSSIDIKDCYATGNASGNQAGGFIGEIGNNSYIERCYSTGTPSAMRYGGGFVGRLSSGSAPFLKNCYALCPAVIRIEGTSTFFGQFTGMYNNYMTQDQNCYYLSGMEFRM